jgi:hypothetical protein
MDTVYAMFPLFSLLSSLFPLFSNVRPSPLSVLSLSSCSSLSSGSPKPRFSARLTVCTVILCLGDFFRIPDFFLFLHHDAGDAYGVLYLLYCMVLTDPVKGQGTH